MMKMRADLPIFFFSKCEKSAIIEAIQKAEKMTSAEIRVHLHRKAKPDIFAHAQEVFESLGMTNTEARNGVLIFLGIKTKRFVLLGDKGIDEKVGSAFWEEIAGKMTECFKEDRFADGIIEAIDTVGGKLSEYFPRTEDDINELADEISYG